MIVGIVVGLVLVFSVYFGIYCIADVDSYIYEYKETPRLYEFYEKKVGVNQTAVFFVGNSLIGNSCYAPLIESSLDMDGYNISVYNLYVSGDSPLRRATQVQNIIDSSPSLVVYGVTYGDIVYGEWRSERIIIVHDSLCIRDDSLYLYSESELSDFYIIPDVFWKRTFVWSALTATTNEYIGDYMYDMHARSMNDIENALPHPPATMDIIDEVNTPRNHWAPVMDSLSTRDAEALNYIVRTLNNADIPVVIVLMPLHPVVSETITNESRENMHAFLNSVNAPWYDMERIYDESYFADSHHMSNYGAKYFSPLMADLIIQELS